MSFNVIPWGEDQATSTKCWVEVFFMERPFARQLQVARVIQYLKDREKEEGGFSLVPDLYPDIEDTYYAIRILKLLHRGVDRMKTGQYLKTVDWTQVNSQRTLYMLVYLHVTLKLEFPLPLTALLNRDWPAFQNLDGRYFHDEIGKLLHNPFKSPAPSSLFRFHDHENLQALRKKVSVLLNHCVDFEREKMIQWVRLSQNGDGGFGFYPGTTSFMENTYCALEILSRLGGSPLKIDDCREYILNCQTKSGGFGRAPISFPFIESTFHAVSGLFLLRGMEKKKKSFE